MKGNNHKKMRLGTKILSCMFVFSLLIGSTTVASAKTHEKHTEKDKQQIYALDDKEFTDYVANYIIDSKKQGKQFSKIQDELLQVDVEIEEKEQIDTEISLRSVPASSIDHTVYTFKRAGQSQYYLQTMVSNSRCEYSPGALDLLSIEWDAKLAKYYSTIPGNYTTYMDGSNRTNGVVLFNVDDGEMDAGSSAYASVKVTPIVRGVWVEIGSKYIHTYNTQNIEWSVGLNVGYEDGGPTGGGSFGLQGSSVGQYWQTYADNAVKF